MREQVDFESACLLHHRVVGEQDAVVTVFTRRYGRLSLWVRGKLGLPGAIPLFKPLLISWRMSNDRYRLTQVEVDRAYPVLLRAELLSEWLYSAFYVNELNVYFLPELADNPSLYNDYLWFLESMSQQVMIDPVLRLYERQLLLSSGLVNDLSVDCLTGQPIIPNENYLTIRHPNYGLGIARLSELYPVDGHDSISITQDGVVYGVIVSGHALIAMNTHQLSSSEVLSEVKRMMRWFVMQLLEGRVLKSRSLFKSYKLKQ